jgi:hypothetical protein
MPSCEDCGGTGALLVEMRPETPEEFATIEVQRCEKCMSFPNNTTAAEWVSARAGIRTLHACATGDPGCLHDATGDVVRVPGTAPVVRREPVRDALSLVEQIVEAARRHGEQDVPEHEVGDLQDSLRLAWARLTPEARRVVHYAFFEDHDKPPAPLRRYRDFAATAAVKRSRSRRRRPTRTGCRALRIGRRSSVARPRRSACAPSLRRSRSASEYPARGSV